MSQVLIVGQDPSSLTMVASMLRPLGLEIDEASSGPAAVRRLGRGGVDLMIARVEGDGSEVMELISLVRRKHARILVVALFPREAPPRQAEAMSLGATAVLGFPVRPEELRGVIVRALRTRIPQVPAKSPALRSHPPREMSAPAKKGRPPAEVASGLVGEDAAFRGAVELASTIAPASFPVLIVGEQGTGKTRVAGLIHGLSRRRDRPLVSVSCARSDDAGLDLELFGHALETGGVAGGRGRLQEAEGDTLVLDEVGSLPLALQAKLHRYLIGGDPVPEGSQAGIRPDLRLLATTRQDLPSLVERGRFSRPLFDLIGAVRLRLPPVRERGRDVVRLADHFRERSSKASGRAVRSYCPRAIRLLVSYDWPGNVRELESLAERSVAACRGGEIKGGDLASIMPTTLCIDPRRPPSSSPPLVGRQSRLGSRPLTLKEAMKGPERSLILQALHATGGNRKEAARALGIDRTTLYNKMNYLGLHAENMDLPPRSLGCSTAGHADRRAARDRP